MSFCRSRNSLAEKTNQDGEEKSVGCTAPDPVEDSVKAKPHSDSEPPVTQSDGISIKLNFHDKIHSVSTYCCKGTFQ